MVASAKANRAFLGRVVRYLAGEASIRQFLDIGSGMPSVGNTHEITQDAGRHSQQSPIPLTGQRPPRGQGASRQFRDHACHSPVPAGDPRDIIRALPAAEVPRGTSPLAALTRVSGANWN